MRANTSDGARVVNGLMQASRNGYVRIGYVVTFVALEFALHSAFPLVVLLALRVAFAITPLLFYSGSFALALKALRAYP